MVDEDDNEPPLQIGFTTRYVNVVESSMAVGREISVKWRTRRHLYRVICTKVHDNRRYMDVTVDYVMTLIKE